MFNCWRRSRTTSLILALLMVGLLHAPAGAQTAKKKRVQKGKAVPKKAQVAPGKKGRVAPGEKGRVAPGKKARVAPGEKSRVRRMHPKKSYVRVRRDYGHVRVTRRHPPAGGTVNVRPIIVRSSRVSPVMLGRFEDRRRDQIRLAIRHFKAGHRERGLEVWGAFVGGLADYHEPIDLDEVMLYVAREGCVHQDDAFLFHAAKLEFLRESEDRLRDYIAQLDEQREACTYGARRCSSESLRNLETEIIRSRADLDILGMELRMANDEFEKTIASSRDYEHRFATVFDDLYREVELRIRFVP